MQIRFPKATSKILLSPSHPADLALATQQKKKKKLTKQDAATKHAYTRSTDNARAGWAAQLLLPRELDYPRV